MTDKRILSIQSHVVAGYVGNKCAIFPLQLHGFNVDSVNTVHLSNHTYYKHVSGQKLQSEELAEMMKSLSLNGLDKYSHLLTGFINSPSLLKQIVSVEKQLREKNPELIYVCDPVLGDNGKLYVPEELIEIYKRDIIPVVDICTPNHFELGLLSGVEINTVEDAIQGIKRLHLMGCKIVVLTSMPSADNPDKMIAVASQFTNGSHVLRVTLEFPKIDAYFVGTGDLFASLFIIWMKRKNENIADALEMAISTMHLVLNRTISLREVDDDMGDRKFPMELKLVQSKSELENPKRLQELFSLVNQEKI